MALHNEGIGMRPEPAHVSRSATQTVTGGYMIGIRRTGTSVAITLTAASEYAGMEMYDSLVQSVERGCLRLELKLLRS